ncbi:DedA family protein [Daejeonella lutea]|uniref:Membrane-associated protein n=1 Tax=Daejeonella lutea TaxID=572036 RepID=A0A1T5BDY0_9SPHI|nr:DedA family protein [Daejeonella lutea]SKB45277.1 membrane-associated protein [Daejeonella lutea]
MLLLIENSNLIEWGGLFIILAFVFLETGLLLGIIVPGGETLLFTSGLLVSTGTLQTDIGTLLIGVILAGISGDISGFYIGKKFKDRLHKKKDTWYFKKRYLTLAEEYVRRHKKGAIVIGKFLPIIRPFTPVITGTSAMPFSKFFALSLVAIASYTCVFTVTGFLIGSQFPEIKNYLGYILPASIIVALIPVIREVRKKAELER